VPQSPQRRGATRFILTSLAKGETAMLKTALIISTTLFGAAAPLAPLSSAAPTPHAEQAVLPVPGADAVVAQFSYLELSHGPDGFGLSITDKTAVFVDVEFPGDLHIRIGF